MRVQTRNPVLKAIQTLVQKAPVFGAICAASLLLVGCMARLGEQSGAAEDRSDCSGVVCSGACVAPLTDDNNCGGCGIVCSDGTYCDEGQCSSYCVAGQAACNGTCVAILSDPQNCGGCDVTCPAGQFCDSGQCSQTCSGGICPTSLGAECAHLDVDPSHCGTCDTVCPPSMTCKAGVCEKGCPEERTACGTTCVDLQVSNLHCGQCGNACPSGVSCQAGFCGGPEACPGGVCPCPSEATSCTGACVDTQSNNFNCGACGNVCPTAQSCTSGVCKCPEDGTLCGSSCVDSQTDSQNCGECGNACSGSKFCQSGVCACADGLSDCSGSCVDMETSPTNCGGCNVSCAEYESCVTGACIFDQDSCGGAPVGIEITRVALYQGVEIALYENSNVVVEGNRAADVIQNRAAMVRVFVKPGTGYVQQELSARIFIKNGEEVSAYFAKRTVTGESSQSDLATTFNINVEGDVLLSDSEYWIELAACGASSTSPPVPLRIPAQNEISLSARRTGVVKVGFLPVRHGGRVPDMSANTLNAYRKAAERMYPTEAVEVVDLSSLLGRDIVFESGQGSPIDLGTLLNSVTDRRNLDVKAGLIDGDVYYYGLVDPASSFGTYCQGGCTTGIGWVPDATGSWAVSHRAAVGVGFGTWGTGTFAHELGHNLGRNHSPCGGAGGPDPNYPYQGAKIGTWGYDLDGAALKNPNDYVDFMGYCSPEWISNYTYNGIANRIEKVNGSAMSVFAASAHYDTVWQRVYVSSQGVTWLSPQEGPSVASDHGVEGVVYDDQGNVVEELRLYRVDMSEGAGYVLYVPEPRMGWFAVGQKGELAAVY